MAANGRTWAAWVELVMGWVCRFFVVRIIGAICLPDEHAREEALVGKRVDVELVPTTAQRVVTTTSGHADGSMRRRQGGELERAEQEEIDPPPSSWIVLIASAERCSCASNDANVKAHVIQSKGRRGSCQTAVNSFELWRCWEGLAARLTSLNAQQARSEVSDGAACVLGHPSCECLRGV